MLGDISTASCLLASYETDRIGEDRNSAKVMTHCRRQAPTERHANPTLKAGADDEAANTIRCGQERLLCGGQTRMSNDRHSRPTAQNDSPGRLSGPSSSPISPRSNAASPPWTTTTSQSALVRDWASSRPSRTSSSATSTCAARSRRRHHRAPCRDLLTAHSRHADVKVGW
jgi:hypothetical protein